MEPTITGSLSFVKTARVPWQKNPQQFVGLDELKSLINSFVEENYHTTPYDVRAEKWTKSTTGIPTKEYTRVWNSLFQLYGIYAQIPGVPDGKTWITVGTLRQDEFADKPDEYLNKAILILTKEGVVMLPPDQLMANVHMFMNAAKRCGKWTPTLENTVKTLKKSLSH